MASVRTGMRSALVAILAFGLFACGHGPSHGDPGVDAAVGGADAAVAPDAAPGSGSGSGSGMGSGSGSGALTAQGTCKYEDQPGWLSCPEGMSCQCYYNSYTIYPANPATLALTVSPTAVTVAGGTLPSNDVAYSVPAATIALAGTPPAGASGEYTAAESATAPRTLTVTFVARGGYVPPSDVLYSSADCGDEGKTLTCTVTLALP